MLVNGTQIVTTGSTGVAGVAPVSLTTVNSGKFELANVKKIGVELIATATGSVDAVVKLLVSQDDVNYEVEDGYPDAIHIADKVRHRTTIQESSIPAARYGKFSFTGQGDNDSDVAMTGIINLIRDER